jgi:hypothetical protein
MKTLIFILFPFFLSAQVIRDKNLEIACHVCETDMHLLFKSNGGIELLLCINAGRPYVLHEGKLKEAGFALVRGGIEISFDGRKILFTESIAYEGDKKYICSTYGLLKSIQ